MNRILSSVIIATLIVLIACNPEEELIDNSSNVWHLLVAKNNGGPALDIIKFPDNTVKNSSVYKTANGKTLEAEVGKITIHGGLIYLFMPSVYKIEVIDEKTFFHVTEYDFSADRLVPSDICFQSHGTNAIVCHGNDSTVTNLDLLNQKISKRVTVGLYPVSITSDLKEGDNLNFVYVANSGDNTLSVIDVRTDSVTQVIPVSDVPYFLRSISDEDKVALVSLGGGKVDSLQKSDAVLTFINTKNFEKTIEGTLPISSGAMSALDAVPMGLTLTKSNYAYIPTEEMLLRFDTRRTNRIIFVSNEKYDSIVLNEFRNENILVINDIGFTKIITADMSNGSLRDTYDIQGTVTAVLPLYILDND